MRLSEFEQSFELKKEVLRLKNETKHTFLGLAFLGGFVCAMLALNVCLQCIGEEKRYNAWFYVLIFSLVAIAIAFAVLGCVFSRRGQGKGREPVFVPRIFGVWLLLAAKEAGFLPSKLEKDGAIVLKETVPATKNKLLWVELGGEDVFRLDLTVWGGVDFSIASMAGVFLLAADLDERKPALLSACVCAKQKNEFDGTLPRGGEIFLLKKGKWTFSGRAIRRDVRASRKFMKKRGITLE